MTVIAVDLGAGEGLSLDRHDARALLAQGLGDHLLDPDAELPKLVRQDERELVAAGEDGLAENRAEKRAGILRGHGAAAGVEHLLGAHCELADVGADEGGGGHAEHGEGRVASPNFRMAVEDAAESAFLYEGVEGCAFIGDGGEAGAVGDLRPEVRELRAGLDGAATLAGGDEERPLEVEARFESEQLLGVGRIG